MSATPQPAPTPSEPPPCAKTRWWEYAIVLLIFLVLVAIFFPVVGGPNRSSQHRAKAIAFLCNLVAACKLYHQEYGHWPTLSATPPGKDFVLSLKTASPVFIRTMTGNFSGHPDEAFLNPRGIQFASFSPDELSQNGTVLLDSFGNDDIVLIFDTAGNGFIAPFSHTLTAVDGTTFTLTQSIAIHASAIAFSPGRGRSPSDAITTWDVTP